MAKKFDDLVYGCPEDVFILDEVVGKNNGIDHEIDHEIDEILFGENNLKVNFVNSMKST